MKSVGKFLKSQAILCLLALFIVFLAISRPSFVSPTNIKNVLMDASIYGVAAMAMTIAIITGAFDLSLSANFAWAQIFFCFLLNTWGDSPVMQRWWTFSKPCFLHHEQAHYYDDLREIFYLA